MKVIDVHAAEVDLSHLVDLACAGEEIVIARGSEPVARLVPIRAETPRRRRGSLEGEVVVPDSFFDPLPPDEIGSEER